MFLIELTPETENAIKIVWWIGLVVALIVTALDVILLLRVIRAAKKIDSLADRTLPAAVGIVENTSAISKLNATNEVAAALIARATPIVNVANAIDGKLATVVAFFGGGRK